MKRWHPFWQLFLARVREFYREPEVLFWVYGFPVLLAVGLGVAFMNRAPEAPVVDVQDEPEASVLVRDLIERLNKKGIQAELHTPEECRQRYRTGRTALFVIPSGQGYTYVYDPSRSESLMARYQVDGIVTHFAARIENENKNPEGQSANETSTQHWKAANSSWQTSESLTTEPGNRYIDFLLPGLMGMNLMGGGFWGVGF